MQSYVIQRAVSETAGKKKDIGMLHVKQIQELEKKQSGSRISLIYGITVWQNYGDICLIKGELEKKSEIELKMEVFPYENMQIQEKKYTKWLDYDKIEKNPYIRTRRTGDYMVINAQGNTKKLNRCMIDEKIPSEYRDSIPLIACGKEILWMVGSRMNERYKINPQTRKVLVLNYQGGNENE